MSSFAADLKYAESMLSAVFSPSLSTAFTAFIEEQEYDDADSILSDLEDESDSNLLHEVNLSNPPQIRLFTVILTVIFKEHDHSLHIALCPDLSPFGRSDAEIQRKRIEDLSVIEFTRLIAIELRALHVVRFDVNSLFIALRVDKYDGHRFVSSLNAPRQQLLFAKLIAKCTVPMGRAKAVHKAIRNRVESQKMECSNSMSGTIGHSAISPVHDPINPFLVFPVFK